MVPHLHKYRGTIDHFKDVLKHFQMPVIPQSVNPLLKVRRIYVAVESTISQMYRYNGADTYFMSNSGSHKEICGKYTRISRHMNMPAK